MKQSLVLIGVSVRAAAASVVRAGFSPHARDAFADADLVRLCPARRVDPYPAALDPWDPDLPPAPWMYTGALENHPDLVDRLAAHRPLWGNAGAVLREVRRPELLADAFRQAGLTAPETRIDVRGLARDGSWLRKPIASAGGLRISPLTSETDETLVEDVAQPAWHYQQRIEGVPCSAVFVAAGGVCVLLGATRQLVGQEWTGAGPFQYAGSWGPLPLELHERRMLKQIGSCLARRFRLVGLFGVDYVQKRDELWPVEVNPRYTASVEILERGLGISAVALHAAACRQGRLPEKLAEEMPAKEKARWCGKAILFARGNVTAGEEFSRAAESGNQPGDWPAAADLPFPGTVIAAGYPVLTVFAAGETSGQVQRRLRARCEQLRRLLPDHAAVEETGERT